MPGVGTRVGVAQPRHAPDGEGGSPPAADASLMLDFSIAAKTGGLFFMGWF